MTGPSFALDRFQQDAIETVDADHSVLVAAPTGAGKTVIAEHAATRALAMGGRTFYTTPVKALSNQKFRDLAAAHGAARVGLLTGDNAINGDAPIVVMTTEVLRNMIYARSPALVDLHWVVLDEVHYLQDPYRGPVWEEVIIQLPAGVRLVCLSATVSNVEDLGAWISTVRGRVDVVVEHHRPVPLENLYGVVDRERGALTVVPTLVKGRPNPRAARFDQPGAAGPGRGRRRYVPPRRLEVLDWLAERDLLPAIHFVFSRAGCDDAARDAWRSGVVLTDPDERVAIRAIVDRHAALLRDDELAVLEHATFGAMLEAGVAAHHAGMVPPFKEAVEEAFAAGLVRLVYATETLALGVNMPARSVVIEKMTKYSGAGHTTLTPADYTQLTGRAGRRGIDDEGHALVCWSPFTTFAEVAELAGSREYALVSAFRPTYNMTANLIRRHGPDEVRALLARSFAQFQADRRIVKLTARLARLDDRAAEARASAVCDLGDVAEYRELESAARRARRARAEEHNAARRAGMAALRPGDVLADPTGPKARRGTPIAVLSVSHRRGGSVRVRVVDTRGRVRALGEEAFDAAPEVVDRITLPEPYAPAQRPFQKAAADALRARGVRRGREAAAPTSTETGSVDHPVARCADREDHVRALDRAERLERDAERLRREARRATGAITRQFDAIVELLEAWGYVDGWQLSADRGVRLAGLFHEADLLVAECLARGLFDGLDAPALAGVASCFCYEHRSPEPPPEPWFPSGAVRDVVERVERVAEELRATEEHRRLPVTRAPDPTFFALAHGWAAGAGLDTVLEDEQVSGGDFVRTVRQIIDLLRQIGDVAGDASLARTARHAADALARGVVTVTSALVGEDPDTTTDVADGDTPTDVADGDDDDDDPGPGRRS